MYSNNTSNNHKQNGQNEGAVSLAKEIRILDLEQVRRVEKIDPHNFKVILRKANTSKKDKTNLLNEIIELRRENKILRTMLFTDRMTGLGNNNKYLDDSKKIISGYVRNIEKNQSGISFVVIDGNGLKKINDSMGHEFGDAAIKRLGLAIKNTIRESDYAYRRGNGADEFIVILENTDKNSAMRFVERLRIAVEKLNLASNDFNVSFSAGIASMRDIDKRILQNSNANHIQETLFKIADRRMYKEKHSRLSKK